jgi:hypothetical protein
MERRILKSKKFYILNELIKFSFLGIIMTVFGFIFTWTPYAITFFISAFSRCDANVSPMAAFICACFAKTSVVWIPIVYMSTSTQFRLSLVDTNTIEKFSGTTTTAGDGVNIAVITSKTQKPAEQSIDRKDY